MRGSEIQFALRALGLDWDEISVMAAAGALNEIRSVIKKAYRRIAYRTHPDRSKSESGRGELLRAQKARELLMKISEAKTFRKPRDTERGDMAKLDTVFELLDKEYFDSLDRSLIGDEDDET